MTEFHGIGRVLIVAGVVLVGVGALLVWGPRIPWLGRLPGDFTFGGPHGKVYVPLGTSLVLSLLVSVILTLLFRRR